MMSAMGNHIKRRRLSDADEELVTAVERELTKDRAPEIGPGYPAVDSKTGSGKRLVAGWQAIWDALSDGEWHERSALTGGLAGREDAGDLAAVTLRNLIIQATAKELLDVEVRGAPPGIKLVRGDTGRRAFVRRADAANRKRVSEAGEGV